MSPPSAIRAFRCAPAAFTPPRTWSFGAIGLLESVPTFLDLFGEFAKRGMSKRVE